jgi:hypothetical protein
VWPSRYGHRKIVEVLNNSILMGKPSANCNES